MRVGNVFDSPIFVFFLVGGDRRREWGRRARTVVMRWGAATAVHLSLLQLCKYSKYVKLDSTT